MIVGRVIIQQYCQEQAERYLCEPDARANQISYMLGCREPAAFTTAFRRWTGKSPTEFRAGVL